MKISMCIDRSAAVCFYSPSLPVFQSGKLGACAHTLLGRATSPNPFDHKFSICELRACGAFCWIIEINFLILTFSSFQRFCKNRAAAKPGFATKGV